MRFVPQRPALPGFRPSARHRALLLAILGASQAPATPDELRALWVDAFHRGYKTPAQTAQLVADARAGNFNALIVQVRKRGDAYYDSLFEPRALDVSPAGYDPLADLLAQAHSGPEPLQVHAWIVAYNIWNSSTSSPAQPDHPFNLHPDWLTENESGALWDGSNYQFDPALPAVQQHTFDIVMDLLTRYPIDGIHFDYIRYSESGSPGSHNVWGYHPEAVARFNRLSDRTGKPPASDPDWLAFRRNQVTALVRKTWLSVRAVRPQVCVSAACITWGNAPAGATKAAFETTEAYRRVLQDWRGWLDEGILDLAVPMIYRRYDSASGAQQYADWSRITKDFQYERSAALGVGNYLNSISDNLTQLKLSRDPAPGTLRPAAGNVGYSYAVTNDAGVSRETFLAALTDPAVAQTYTPGQPPLFAEPAAVPAQPWKSDPDIGHLSGFVVDADDTALDGATIALNGPESRTLLSDATGFFGAVGLAPGDYLVRVSFPGLPTHEQSATVAGGSVAAIEAVLAPLPPDFAWEDFAVLDNPFRVVLTWRSRPGYHYAVQASPDLQSWTTLAADIPPADNFRNTFQDIPPPAATRRFYRIVESAP